MCLKPWCHVCIFNLQWLITQTNEFQHKKYSSSSQYCILHSVIQTTEFLSEGTKLEITSANEIPTDKHDELKDFELGAGKHTT